MQIISDDETHRIPVAVNRIMQLHTIIHIELYDWYLINPLYNE